MRLHIHHQTLYRYERKVDNTVQQLRLTPRRETRQRSLEWKLSTPGRRTEQVDAFGNVSHLLTVDEPHTELRLTVDGIVETEPSGSDGRIADDGGLSPLVYLTATPLTTADAAVAALAERALLAEAFADHALAHPAALAGNVLPVGMGTVMAPTLRLQRLQDLSALVRETIRYTPGATTVDLPAAASLARGEGVCQDHAHLFLACCRASGLAARYVSGYFFTGDAGDLASHAWVDVWMPPDAIDPNPTGYWLGLDVTHGMPAGTHHVRLAVGRDYLDAAPVRGVRRGGGSEVLSVRVLVGDRPASATEQAQQQQQQQQ
jgi:transglutaminase-like putative cysteine protease